jgi:hypothetical protein
MKKIILVLGFVLLSAPSAIAGVQVKNEDNRDYPVTFFVFFGTPIRTTLKPNANQRFDCNRRCAIKLSEGQTIPLADGDVVTIKRGSVRINMSRPVLNP